MMFLQDVLDGICALIKGTEDTEVNGKLQLWIFFCDSFPADCPFE